MRHFLFFFLLFAYGKLFGQFDTTMDYKQRFYKDGKLLTQNLYADSLKKGLWIEYYDKNFDLVNTSADAKYFRLVEYLLGKPIGKVYDFYKNGKLQMLGGYVQLEPEIKRGTFVYFTKKGKVTAMHYYSEDTLINVYYYKNGKPYRKELFKRGYMYFAYQHGYGNSTWFYKNGKINRRNFFDTDLVIDTSYHIRKNGTFRSKEINSKQKYERIHNDRKGRLEYRSVFYTQGDSNNIYEVYKRGKLVTNKSSTPSKKIKLLIPDTVKYYGGLIGGNNASVIIKSGDSVSYNVNNIRMSKASYEDYQLKQAQFMAKRKPRHYYMNYSKDSVLTYAGIFKEVDLPCGQFFEYFPNGKIKMQGDYNEKGQKHFSWIFYNEAGEIIYNEFYLDGVKK